MGSESGIIIRGVFSKVGSLPPSSFCALLCFLPQLSFLAVLLQSSLHAQSIGASPLQVLVLMSRALSLSLCPGRVMWVLSSRISAHGPHPPHPRASCPMSVCSLCQHIQPLPGQRLGHLSPFCKANRSPGKGSSSCSASWDFRHLLLAHTHRHTHTGCLYLTNNYLTKYANSIITVICLAVISV